MSSKTSHLTSCASELRRIMHGWNTYFVLRNFWLSMRTVVKNIGFNATKERSRTPMLTPRGRSAPLAKLCSNSNYSRSQHSRYWSTNKVEDESSRYDPQQPVDFTTTLTHRVDHGPRDETNTDAVGDGIGQWHGDHGKKNGQ